MPEKVNIFTKVKKGSKHNLHSKLHFQNQKILSLIPELKKNKK